MNIKCIETGKVYVSARHVQEKTGIAQSSISFILRGKWKSVKGLHFESTAEFVTETRTCHCGKEFIPYAGSYKTCSDECYTKIHHKNRRKKQAGVRQFTFDTNLMIVQEWERRSSFDRLSEATGRTAESLYAQCCTLMLNGQYALIKKMLNIQSTLQNHETGVRIA